MKKLLIAVLIVFACSLPAPAKEKHSLAWRIFHPVWRVVKYPVGYAAKAVVWMIDN